MPLVHAACVEWLGAGILIRGKSGAGKSDLALRLIDAGAALVADDQVLLENGIASAPARLQGLLEVRGLGIVRLPFVKKTAVVLTIDLCSADEIERLPDRFGGIMRLDPFCASAVAKIKLALRVAAGERHLLSDAETVIL